MSAPPSATTIPSPQFVAKQWRWNGTPSLAIGTIANFHVSTILEISTYIRPIIWFQRGSRLALLWFHALKAMYNSPQRIVHRHICKFFEGKVDHEGWHKSQCIPMPKEGNLSDPNKWQRIMLMDICSKVFLSVMTARAYTLLDKHGTRFQFGGTPGVGCRDELFTLKALLNAQHNHDLALYVGFVDLVKAYDTANHKLLIDVPCRYAPPP